MTETLLLEPEVQTAAPEIKAVAIVDRMLEILAEPEHWCRGRSAEDINHKVVGLDDRRAVRFCVGGALQKATDELGLDYLHSVAGTVSCAMSDVSRRRCGCMGSDYVYFNDFSATTHADVLSMLREVREVVR